jgi:hypothetical protein
VLVGTIFLAVCLFRAMAGHFTPQQHFGFEAAAWYWHFVDVIWLFLFTFIYVWGSAGATIAHLAFCSRSGPPPGVAKMRAMHSAPDQARHRLGRGSRRGAAAPAFLETPCAGDDR